MAKTAVSDTSLSAVLTIMFRKLSPVNEKLKRCEWQLVFDVVLANTIHHVFERNVNCPLPEKEVRKSYGPIVKIT